MAIVDRKSLPVALRATSASPHEVTLVEKTLAGKCTKKTPKRLVGRPRKCLVYKTPNEVFAEVLLKEKNKKKVPGGRR